MAVPDTALAIGAVALALAGMVGWLSLAAIRARRDDALYLVAEWRLVQAASLVLVFVAASYVGVAAAQAGAPGASFDAVLAVGFLVLAFTASQQEPPQALALLALGFLAHVVLDLAHRPGWLPHGGVASWYVIGCAIHNVVIGALCYLPLLGRDRR
ncbi:MAG: hypothetical protein KJ061_16495 [Vicinamibacteraceae bacterium]|nr:hypothetical protein [Vicinamibacteraceae bacterium]